jgi:hypothetical protein
MKNLISIALLAISAAFTGCGNSNIDQWRDEGRIARIIEIGKHWDIFCDRSTNIAYLMYHGGYRAGITPYLNSDGQPFRCNEVHR